MDMATVAFIYPSTGFLGGPDSLREYGHFSPRFFGKNSREFFSRKIPAAAAAGFFRNKFPVKFLPNPREFFSRKIAAAAAAGFFRENPRDFFF